MGRWELRMLGGRASALEVSSPLLARHMSIAPADLERNLAQ